MSNPSMTITFIIKEGEKILTQATQEVSKDFSLMDFLNKTVPGLQESINAFLDKVDGEYVPAFKAEVETLVHEAEAEVTKLEGNK